VNDVKIRDFLKIKSRPVVTISPNDTVSVAIQRLIENDIGALPVCDDKGMLVGIVSERDLLRICHLQSSAIGSTKVEEAMTKHVAIGTPEDDVDYVASVMKQKRIRHLPILADEKLEGMVSMRDIIDVQLEEAQAEIRYARLVKTSHLGGRRPLV
jgi:CBS domain-containing protein